MNSVLAAAFLLIAACSSLHAQFFVEDPAHPDAPVNITLQTPANFAGVNCFSFGSRDVLSLHKFEKVLQSHLENLGFKKVKPQGWLPNNDYVGTYKGTIPFRISISERLQIHTFLEGTLFWSDEKHEMSEVDVDALKSFSEEIQALYEKHLQSER